MNASGRRLEGSAYTDDDGAADAGLVAALATYDADPATFPAALAALAAARLLVPVVAVLGEVESAYDDKTGRVLARDKSSDMAAVLMTGADGRRALLAFTSTETLGQWDAEARPVPVAAVLAAQTAVQEGADALVVDLAGPHRFVVSGADLHRIASGWRPVQLADGEWAWLASEPAAKDSAPSE